MHTFQEPQVTSNNNEEDIVDEEEEENVRQASRGSICPDSQELFLTLEPVPSQDQLAAECDAREDTSVGQRLSQIRRQKKKIWKDMFNELMRASESDKTELSAWRITLSENLDMDREDRRAFREQERAMQDEMLQILKEQSDMLRCLVEVQERQLDARDPLQPMLNLLPSSPSSTSTSPKCPMRWGEQRGGWESSVLLALNTMGEGTRTRRCPFPQRWLLSQCIYKQAFFLLPQ
ncbi:uncharacterized protein LOC128833562 [Malaclemys terrapin pileata]|uniref:uncharacterized protein LOC128833562 n=1 Tax=Malaclemys terrapin pileata TaxID=2991368 RepID=UPI0023A82785|nr:uncharacterized protein LOC128833562 [Malaclemys terrapin pileata]